MTTDLTSLNEFTGAAIGICSLLALMVGWVKVLRPRWRNTRQEVIAVKTALIGRDAIVDPVTGKELAPAQDGIGVRQARTEEQMAILTGAVAQIADSFQRLENHEGRIKALEEATIERVVTKAESTAAWRAMEAAAKAQPDVDVELD